MDFIIDLEKLIDGSVSDAEVRKIIRYGLKFKLQSLEREHKKSPDNLTEFVNQLKNGPIAVETEAANEQHYEVPAKFYQKFLDRRLKYSCCLWPEGCNSIDEASEFALSQVVDRAQLEDGQSILELGCGWGSLSLYMAEKMPNSSIVCVSNSAGQKEFIESQKKHLGLDNLEVITCDINNFETSMEFDRIVSIEMFEHARNFEILFERVSNWLNPSGLFFVHIFSHKRHSYLYENNDNWISEFFFSGGLMPSDDLFFQFQNHLKIVDHWNLCGTHYEKTAEAWLKKADEESAEIINIFKEEFDDKHAQKQFVMWRLFFLVVAESWGYNNGDEWIISHYLFRKKNEDVS